MQLQQLAKNRHFLLVFSCFWVPPLAPNELLPRAIFDGICDVLCTSSTLQKRAVFCLPGAGRRHMAPPPIAKAKATPHAMRSNMPGIRCLVHRRIWKRSVGVTAHVIAPASKIVSHCRSFSHLFLFTILPVKRAQETRNIHSSTLLSTSMATKGCGIQFPFPARVHEFEPIE